MNFWLLTWNPTRIDARSAGLHEAWATRQDGGECASDWSVGGRRHIAQGDRLYLMRLGPEPSWPSRRGIVAVGEALAPPFPREHWSGEANRSAWYMPLVWLACRPYGSPLVCQRRLKAAFPGMCFSPQSSGMRLRADVSGFIDVRCGLAPPTAFFWRATP